MFEGYLAWRVFGLDVDERLELAKRHCEEIVTEEELKNLLEAHSSPKAYWGFECSGQ